MVVTTVVDPKMIANADEGLRAIAQQIEAMQVSIGKTEQELPLLSQKRAALPDIISEMETRLATMRADHRASSIAARVAIGTGAEETTHSHVNELEDAIATLEIDIQQEKIRHEGVLSEIGGEENKVRKHLAKQQKALASLQDTARGLQQSRDELWQALGEQTFRTITAPLVSLQAKEAALLAELAEVRGGINEAVRKANTELAQWPALLQKVMAEYGACFAPERTDDDTELLLRQFLAMMDGLEKHLVKSERSIYYKGAIRDFWEQMYLTPRDLQMFAQELGQRPGFERMHFNHRRSMAAQYIAWHKQYRGV